MYTVCESCLLCLFSYSRADGTRSRLKIGRLHRSISSPEPLGSKREHGDSSGFFWSSLTLAGLSAIPLAAQQSVSVRVMTEPAGARFTVDGTLYIQPTSFLWPVGSKHVVTIVSPTIESTGIGAWMRACDGRNDHSIRSVMPHSVTPFSAWESVRWRPSAALQPESGDHSGPKAHVVDGSFTVEYRVDVAFFDRGAAARTIKRGESADAGAEAHGEGSGVVFVNGGCLDGTGYVWAPAGALHLQAVPFDGLCFSRLDL